MNQTFPRFTFVSGSAEKIAEVHRYLPEVLFDCRKLSFDEVQALNPREVVAPKVRLAYEQVSGPVLVEDVGLHIHCMNGFPGALVKHAVDTLGAAGIARMVDGPAQDHPQGRAALARVCFGYFDGMNDPRFFEALMPGRIAGTPDGTYFGWSPVFIPDNAFADDDGTGGGGYTGGNPEGLTISAMSEAQRDVVNYRRRALAQLREFLDAAT